MDLLNGKIKNVYFKYLAAAFGSALITSIYSIVDMAMVGRYHGPEGSAALAVVAPVWNIIYSFGLLMGIGGSVLFATIRGKSENGERQSNEYFTASVAGSVILAAVIWLVVIFFDRELLLMFGAQDDTLSLAREYVKPIKFAIPLFCSIRCWRHICVIVGRCADYILKDYKPFRIFVYADMESKIKRCMEKAPEDEKMTEKDLKNHILAVDKKRARYYKLYTGRTWGNRLNFDLCVNTTQTVIKEIVPAIARLFV